MARKVSSSDRASIDELQVSSEDNLETEAAQSELPAVHAEPAESPHPESPKAAIVISPETTALEQEHFENSEAPMGDSPPVSKMQDWEIEIPVMDELQRSYYESFPAENTVDRIIREIKHPEHEDEYRVVFEDGRREVVRSPAA